MNHENGHRIVWDADLSIARVWGVGVVDEEVAAWFYECTTQMANEHGDRINWIFDLSQITNVTSKARQSLAQVSKHPSIQKYAFFGASIFMRTLANFILSAAGDLKQRHFSTESEALKWLMKE